MEVEGDIQWNRTSGLAYLFREKHEIVGNALLLTSDHKENISDCMASCFPDQACLLSTSRKINTKNSWTTSFDSRSEKKY